MPCVDGRERRYVDLDAAASTGALPGVLARVREVLPWYSSVHRGAGYKSQVATARYEDAHLTVRWFAGRSEGDDVAIICRNTTEAINHLAYRLALEAGDVVVTTVVEHHANLLPWARVATRRFVECEPDGTFGVAAVRAALDAAPRPRLLAITGASNVTGWLPPLDAIIACAHEREILVAVDAAQLAPHRPLPAAADFVAFSGHKMYAPFGAGALVGPRATFARGDPFLVGGGAVARVDLDEVVWLPPPEREEAGSPNVIGAVALAEAARELVALGWPRIAAHDARLARALRDGLRAIPGVRVLGPGPGADTLPIAAFVIEGVPHALVAARLSCELAIGVRHGCFCAHPYLVRLLGLDERELAHFRAAAARGDRRDLPGAVRASAGLSTTLADIEALLDGVAAMASGAPPPVPYAQDAATGDYRPA
ncbi:MAG TPA: aminotransferase class V-fold PLP-dependent enzyme [Solirubrobacteraceae bacterium]